KRIGIDPLQTMRGRDPNFWSHIKKTIESVSVRNPGIQSWCIRFCMRCPLLLAIEIFRCKSRQLATCASVRWVASFSGKPSFWSASYDSSRWAASSSWTSSFSPASNARPERRRRTNSCQSGMSHLREPLQRAKKFRPFALERRELLLPCRCEPVAAPPAAIGAGFPGAANPALLLHAIEHGVKRRERETQCAVGLLLDAPCQLVTVQRGVLQNTENRQLRRASLDAGTNHSHLPLTYKNLIYETEIVNWSEVVRRTGETMRFIEKAKVKRRPRASQLCPRESEESQSRPLQRQRRRD